MNSTKQFWDFSTLPEDHPYHDNSTRNKLGLFKLETGGDLICSTAGKIKYKNFIKCRIRTYLLIFYFFSIFIIFSGVRPKVYSLAPVPWEVWNKIQNSPEYKNKPFCIRKLQKKSIKRLKGVKSHLVALEFTHQNYIDAILSGKPKYVKYFTINSRGHVVTTNFRGKLGLSGETYFISSMLW